MMEKVNPKPAKRILENVYPIVKLLNNIFSCLHHVFIIKNFAGNLWNYIIFFTSGVILVNIILINIDTYNSEHKNQRNDQTQIHSPITAL